MSKFTIKHVLLAILTAQVSHVFGQELAVSETIQNQVLLNDLVATRGQEVILHMRFRTQKEVKINKLKAEIIFPVPQLRLIRMDRPYLLEKFGGRIVVEEMGLGRIQVEITIPENSPESLPEEAVAFLVMQVAGDVEVSPLTIKAQNVQMRNLEGEILEGVQGSQSHINLVSEALYPLISCFFYMH